MFESDNGGNRKSDLFDDDDDFSDDNVCNDGIGHGNSSDIYQVQFLQHNYGPAYRRIGVYVTHTILSCYGNAIKKLISFFIDPIKVHAEEKFEENRIAGRPEEIEEEKNWDIDVQVTNTNVCLLEELYGQKVRFFIFAFFHSLTQLF